MSLEYYDELDFWYGVLFILATSISFLLAVFASILFRDGKMGNIFIIMALGLTFNTVGDIRYYYLEISDLYEYTQSCKYIMDYIFHADHIWLVPTLQKFLIVAEFSNFSNNEVPIIFKQYSHS